jgi:hypothetical protein
MRVVIDTNVLVSGALEDWRVMVQVSGMRGPFMEPLLDIIATCKEGLDLVVKLPVDLSKRLARQRVIGPGLGRWKKKERIEAQCTYDPAPVGHAGRVAQASF